jgi:serine/threonine protein kinase
MFGWTKMLLCRYEPYFVGGLPGSIVLDLQVEPRHVGHGTNGKVVAFATPHGWVAVKVFKTGQNSLTNQEIAFFGSSHVERVKYERLLVRCGFVQSLLCKAGRSCKVCLACNVKPVSKHYHVVMPLMSTSVHDMLRDDENLVDLSTRMHIFSSIACIVQNLADHQILFGDLKLENIVYNQYNQAVLGCDVGALFRLDHRAMWEKQATKFVLNHSVRTVVFADNKHAKHATPLVSMPATYVNLFLQLDNANYADLSDATHHTNHFSLLCVLMDLLAIRPPRFTLCRTRKARIQACAYYNNCTDYVDKMSNKSVQAKLASQTNCNSKIVQLIELVCQTWQACNQFQIQQNYAALLGQHVQSIMQS